MKELLNIQANYRIVNQHELPVEKQLISVNSLNTYACWSNTLTIYNSAGHKKVTRREVSIERRLISVKELAKYTGWSTSQIYHFKQRKLIPYIPWSHSIKFDLRKIDKLIEKKTVKSVDWKNK